MAIKVKLTNGVAPTLTCPAGQHVPQIYWDTDLPGFGVRVSPRGKAVFFVQYRDKLGKQEKLTLGDARNMKANKAREAAETAMSQVQLGENPQATLRAKRQGDRVIDLVDAYLARQKMKLRERSYTEVERALKKAAKPLHQHKAEAVSRREIANLISKIAETSGAVAANRVRANLSAMWTWSLKEGRVEGGNPVAYTNKATQERPRDRVLTDAEVALIWRCTNTGHDYDRIVRVLMLTAARREEVGGMRWCEVAVTPEGSGIWTIPGDRAKNGDEHEVPLGVLAIEQLPPARDGLPIVFGRPTEDAGGFSGWSKCKERLDARMLAALTQDHIDAHGGEPKPGEITLASWRLHDLRRTFSTWANEDGLAPHIIEAVLNHKSGTARRGVAGVYNHAKYRAQKRSALAAWEEHVRRVAGIPQSRENGTPSKPFQSLPPTFHRCSL